MPNDGYNHHLHAHRRSPALATRSLLHGGERLHRVAASRSNCVTSRCRVACWPLPRGPDPRAAGHRRSRRARRAGAAARGQRHQAPNVSASIPQLKATIGSSGCKGTRCPTTRRQPSTPEEEDVQVPLRTRSRAPRSTRCCVRATPTAARRRRSRSTPARTRTRWCAWAKRLEERASRRWAHDDFPLQRAVRSPSPRRRPQGRARCGDGSVTVLNGVDPRPRR